MKIAFLTLGCKVNQYEADSLARAFEDEGHTVCENLDKDVDVVVLSTCAVTNEAERKSRQMIAKINKSCPNAKILVCGCASQHSSKNFEGKQGVKVVVGTSGKIWLKDMLAESDSCFVLDPPLDFEEMPPAKKHRTRSYLKIQDGCNNFCSYCLIPFLRGRSRSRGLESIVVEAFNMAKASKEIVLTGIDLSSWGKDINLDLIDLANSLSTINARIRFSSMEAGIITDDFLSALKKMPNFCPHFHLSLQSGCNKTLKDMNRKYTKEEFIEKTKMIKTYFSDAAITTDVIVGYPTETDEDFAESLDTIKKIGFADIHFFPFSKRAGTVAARLKQLDGEIVKKRIEEISKVRDKLKAEFLSKQEGMICEVLTEQEKDGFTTGHARNFTKVYLPSGQVPLNALVVVRAGKPYLDGVKGEIIQIVDED